MRSRRRASASAAELVRYRRPSRYAESDALVPTAAAEFAGITDPAQLLASVSSWVGTRLAYVSGSSLPTDGAMRTLLARQGVCRDFAHLAVTFCRCMNIPARYCTGYLGDIGVPAVPDPMDFSAWFEVYLGGRWYTFDARHNTPRIGRIVMARGRDATDVAISTSFGPARLAKFEVHTDEVVDEAPQWTEWLQAAE